MRTAVAAAPGGTTGMPLFEKGEDLYSWSFSDGREFPGATGSATVDDSQKHGDLPALKITGDFTGGGKYVCAGRKLFGADIESLNLWVRDGVGDFLGMRIIDSTGQTHQIRLKLPVTPDWQPVRFPLKEFFASKGTPDAFPDVVRYQHYGGNDDGQWHGPASGIYFIVTEPPSQKTHTLWISEPAIVPGTLPPAKPAPDNQAASLPTTPVALDDYLDMGTDWEFSRGQEYAGAKGQLEVVKDTPAPGKFAQKLSGDFTGGGKYVGMGKNLSVLDVQDIRAFRMRIKTPNAKEIGLRVVDSSGQVHLKKHLPIQADDNWHDYVYSVSDIVGGEHWGGENDGRWHGPGKTFFISLTDSADPDGKKPEILFAGIQVDAITGGGPQATWYQEDFEKSATFPEGWEKQGDASISDHEKFHGSRSLQLARTEDKFDVETAAISPAVKITPGPVEVGGAFKTDLHSPDSSFNASVSLQCLDNTGHLVENVRVAEYYGTANWVQVKKQVAVPAGATTARLRIQFNKTHGHFWADDLSISSVAAPITAKSKIRRILLKTSAPGNMLLPDSKPIFDLTVETLVPLPLEKCKATAVVRDYWGAEQSNQLTVNLEAKGRSKGVFNYKATIDLSANQYETGKYYELHVSADDGSGNSVREYSSFVFLPEAVTKKYPWRDIPFSSRNWDNRIPDYFTLSDRIGLRLIGAWGSWSAQPPYKPNAPGITTCRKLDAGVLTRTPIIDIEHHVKGYEAYDETSLREGIHHFIDEYGKDNRLMFVLGNEPQTSGETVAKNVELYKLMYQEIKKISPDTFVIGTSVGPVEEYFKLGFQNYCDAVDYHTYEDSNGVRKTFEKYKQLFDKYGGNKPIWSTESGLNSQGLTRRAVAADLIRKFTLFFANGGQNISWFGICYPDREGKLRGGADDSFNVFNGLYGLYSPRLDAIAYYNMVNGICVKKFVCSQKYDGDVEAYLFRDKEGHNLQVIWKNRGAEDVMVPLKDIEAVRMIRIDGVVTEMNAAKHGLTLRLSEDPILLLYDGDHTTLPEKLNAPVAAIINPQEKITRGESFTFNFSLNGARKEDVKVNVPPFWKTHDLKIDGDSKGSVIIDSPADTEARYAPVSLSVKGKDGGNGDLAVFIPVQSQLSARLMPVPTSDAKGPEVEFSIHNNNATPEKVHWKVSLPLEIPLRAGRYSMEVTQPSKAWFGEASEGSKEIAAHGDASIRLPLSGVDPFNCYKVTASITDKLERTITAQRYVAGFVGVPKVQTPLTMNGDLDDPDWARCVPQKINEERQYRHLTNTHVWAGPSDLSGELRFLWDDKYLYLGVKVTDNVFHNENADAALWSGDGLQVIIDPARTLTDKPGKYDYGFALTPKGPQAWCFLSADGRVPAGEASDIIVVAKPLKDGTGSVNYEVGIPWSRLLPFNPAAGADLGLAMALNEDDTPKRDGFMAWFGDIQTKEVTPVADLILQP